MYHIQGLMLSGQCCYFVQITDPHGDVNNSELEISELENSVTGQRLRCTQSEYSTFLIRCSRQEMAKQPVDVAALEALFDDDMDNAQVIELLGSGPKPFF